MVGPSLYPCADAITDSVHSTPGELVSANKNGSTFYLIAFKVENQ
jgi:hypothetical protein